MTSLQLALLQGALLILVAPVCAGIGKTVVTLIQQRALVFPWVMYRRENNAVASVALGAALLFGILLPVFGVGGFAGIYGNIGVLIALLALIGGASALLDAKSLVPMAVSAYAFVLLALGIAASSVGSTTVLLAMSGRAEVSTIFALVAMALILIALRNDVSSERTQDVRMVLGVAMGIFLVNLLAMMCIGHLLTHEQFALNILIVAGKAIGITLVVELLAACARRYSRVTPKRLIRLAAALGILAIIILVWFSNPSL